MGPPRTWAGLEAPIEWRVIVNIEDFVNSQLQFLIELQKFDLRIFQIQDTQRKAPDLLKTAESEKFEDQTFRFKIPSEKLQIC